MSFWLAPPPVRASLSRAWPLMTLPPLGGPPQPPASWLGCPQSAGVRALCKQLRPIRVAGSVREGLAALEQGHGRGAGRRRWGGFASPGAMSARCGSREVAVPLPSRKSLPGSRSTAGTCAKPAQTARASQVPKTPPSALPGTWPAEAPRRAPICPTNGPAMATTAPAAVDKVRPRPAAHEPPPHALPRPVTAPPARCRRRTAGPRAPGPLASRSAWASGRWRRRGTMPGRRCRARARCSRSTPTPRAGRSRPARPRPAAWARPRPG